MEERQSYTPIDYKSSKSLKNNDFLEKVRRILIYLGIIVVIYTLFSYNQRISLIEKTFEKKLEDYKKRLEKIENTARKN